MVQPAASAGAIFIIAAMTGKFHGVIAARTPTGSRRTSVSNPIGDGRRSSNCVDVVARSA